MVFNLFSTGRLSHQKKIIRKTYIVTFQLSKIFSTYTKIYRFTEQSVLVNGKLTPAFSISICFGVEARETRLSDNMTLR